MKNLNLFLLAGLLFAISCNNKPKVEYPANTETDKLELKEAYPNLRFTRPVDFQAPDDGSNRVFVVEQEGIISYFDNNTETDDKYTFLDISSQVDDNHNEEGLLGLAFHPNFKDNGYFYVNYTVSSDETLVSRFTVSPSDKNKAEPGSELVILRFDQPYGNHNGGQLAFGPDGYLYISVGDGGSGGDPKNNGQNKNSLLGTILRLDIDNPSGGKNYGIPEDNPFFNRAMTRPEIYAYGLRNPWRISFDEKTGKLWAADVGQNAFEEVDIIEPGKNYGWNEMEGFHTFKDGENSGEYTPPVLEIPQSTGDKSITGGYVYRGSNAPSLTGKYVFADYVSGRIYALTESNEGAYSNSTLMDTDLNIASFGTDQNNELYICAFDGKIYTLKE